MRTCWLMMAALASLGCSTATSSPDASTSGDFPDATATIDAPIRPIDASIDAPTQPTGPVTVRIQASIDGHTRLTLNGNMAQWHHLVNAAPGRLNGTALATQVNGTDWFPTWPDLPTPENRNCNCMSDMYTGISPAIPRSPMTLDGDWTGRDRVILIQEPSSVNSYTTILEFEDDPSGAALYMVELTFDPM